MITKPKGCYDVTGDVARKYQRICDVVSAYAKIYNYKYIRTPLFESTELFKRGVGDTTDIVQKETYDFTDRGGRSFTLRPEGTAGVVRNFIEDKLYGNQSSVVKEFYIGTMYRYERPGLGRNREFTQFGVECLGSDDEMMDAEVISLSYNILKELGLDVTVKINNLGSVEDRENYKKALVEYLTPHINDLCEDCQNRYEKNPLRLLDCKVESCKVIFEKPEVKEVIQSDFICPECHEHFEQLKSYLDALNIKYSVNKLLVRGLDYYNRTVFEVKSNNLGSQNAVCGGGRYDSLVRNLGGVDTPAIGFAMGMERLYSLIEKKENDLLDAYVVSTNKIEALKLVKILRDANISTDFDFNAKKFTKQMEKASKVAKYAVILGEDEIESGMVSIKNLSTSEQKKIDRNNIITYFN